MKDIAHCPALVPELRRALQHLYDLSELRRNSLVRILGLDQHKEPGLALRRLLVAAIESLKPPSAVPARSNDWRTYQILSHHYVEQLTQQEVASDLALSVRQLQRQEMLALQALADHLRQHYPLKPAPGYQEMVQAMDVEDAQDVDPGTQTPTREQELEWLRRSTPSEPTDLAEVLHSALKNLAPLTQLLDVRIECAVPESLPPVATPVTAVREALLIVLTVATRHAPGGGVAIGVVDRRSDACVSIRAWRTRGSARTLGKEHLGPLEIARELVALSGGSLEIDGDERGEAPLSARVLLPAAERVPVLVVDDNSDTLRLFQRYLAGSRYRYFGASDPQQVLTLAESLAPQVIVVDIMLPGVDGWELLGRLRAHPKTRDVPLIVCTILPQEQLALALGAAAFVGKPFSRQTLLSALDHQIDLLVTESR